LLRFGLRSQRRAAAGVEVGELAVWWDVQQPQPGQEPGTNTRSTRTFVASVHAKQASGQSPTQGNGPAVEESPPPDQSPFVVRWIRQSASPIRIASRASSGYATKPLRRGLPVKPCETSRLEEPTPRGARRIPEHYATILPGKRHPTGKISAHRSRSSANDAAVGNHEGTRIHTNWMRHDHVPWP
jgi:hypothetical protein